MNITCLLKRSHWNERLTFLAKKSYTYMTEVMSHDTKYHETIQCKIYNLISESNFKLNNWFKNMYKIKFKY